MVNIHLEQRKNLPLKICKYVSCVGMHVAACISGCVCKCVGMYVCVGACVHVYLRICE